MKKILVLCLVLLGGLSSAQLINGQYGYWNKNVITQQPSILTSAGVFGAIRDPFCGEVESMRYLVSNGFTPKFTVIYQHYGKVNQNALGYRVKIASNSFSGSTGWRLQGDCTIAFKFESEKLEFSNEARKNYNQAYKTTDYIVVFDHYEGQVFRYTFAAP